MSDVIEISGLTKRFGTTTALDGLELRVAEGEVHGFLGPNGAGKTTTLRVLLGTVRADGGTVRVLGMDPWNDVPALHARLAYVPGDVSLWPNLTGGEVIDLLARLQGGHDAQRRAELLETLRPRPDEEGALVLQGQPAEGRARRGARDRRRALPARRADERPRPADGETLPRAACNELRGRGRTVLLSSHILSEAEALSDRISIIRAGTIVETGRLAEMRHLQRLTISAETEHELHGIDDIPGLHDVSFVGQPPALHREPGPPRRAAHRTSRRPASAPSRATRRRSSSCSSAHYGTGATEAHRCVRRTPATARCCAWRCGATACC